MSYYPSQGFTESGGDHTPSSSFPPTLILILSRLVHDMERSTISYLISYGDECFPPFEEGPIVATPMGEMLARAKDIAQVSFSVVATPLARAKDRLVLVSWPHPCGGRLEGPEA